MVGIGTVSYADTAVRQYRESGITPLAPRALRPYLLAPLVVPAIYVLGRTQRVGVAQFGERCDRRCHLPALSLACVRWHGSIWARPASLLRAFCERADLCPGVAGRRSRRVGCGACLRSSSSESPQVVLLFDRRNCWCGIGGGIRVAGRRQYPGQVTRSGILACEHLFGAYAREHLHRFG